MISLDPLVRMVGDSNIVEMFLKRCLKRCLKLVMISTIASSTMTNLTSCSQSSPMNDPDRITSSGRLKVIGNKYIKDVECWMTLKIKY
jgi:hypothetical protein